MTTPSADAPNADQIEYWNGVAGPKWVALEARLDAQIGGLGLRALDRVAPAPGERVLDVGCGCGASALETARRVGREGAVLGVDVSAVMLARARQRAAEAGLAQLAFEVVDAQIHPFEPGAFDALFSRFGVMFFSDPQQAFANLFRAVRRGGRLGFVCWQALARNPWMGIALTTLLQHVPPPPPPAPDAPGPFAFADPARVDGILSGAGFRDVEFEPLEEPLTLGGGGDLDDALDFLMKIGPGAALLDETPPATQQRARAAVRVALEPYSTPDGVRLDAAAWLVTARCA